MMSLHSGFYICFLLSNYFYSCAGSNSSKSHTAIHLHPHVLRFCVRIRSSFDNYIPPWDWQLVENPEHLQISHHSSITIHHRRLDDYILMRKLNAHPLSTAYAHRRITANSSRHLKTCFSRRRFELCAVFCESEASIIFFNIFLGIC